MHIDGFMSLNCPNKTEDFGFGKKQRRDAAMPGVWLKLKLRESQMEKLSPGQKFLKVAITLPETNSSPLQMGWLEYYFPIGES